MGQTRSVGADVTHCKGPLAPRERQGDSRSTRHPPSAPSSRT